MDNKFFFETKQQVSDYCDAQLKALNTMNCEDALDDGCDNENAEQNSRFYNFIETTEQMVCTLGSFEFKSSKVLDSKKMKQVWCEAVSRTSKCDEWLHDYEALMLYFENIKKML